MKPRALYFLAMPPKSWYGVPGLVTTHVRRRKQRGFTLRWESADGARLVGTASCGPGEICGACPGTQLFSTASISVGQIALSQYREVYLGFAKQWGRVHAAS